MAEVQSDVQSNPAANQEQYLRDLHMFAAHEMHQGATEQAVHGKLVQHGLNPAVAQTIVGNVFGAQREAIAAHRNQGLKNMLFGALWCVGGLVVTIGGYVLAAKNGGGSYMIFWGAVIFGAFQFFRGLAQWLSRG